MSSPKPFRFLAEPGDVPDGPTLAATARRAEAMGYSVLVYPDHLVTPLGVLPALAYAAAATERIRLAPFVLNNDLRHPAVLAQDLATIDLLSGGRLEVGIGAGWNAPEYASTGIPFDPVGTRVARLAESIAVLKGCFADGSFDHAGTHYALTAHDGLPKPAQRPHPPFFIGGGGRRILTLAAREADTVGLAPRLLPGAPRADPRTITIAATEEKIAWIRDAAGDRFDALELNVYPTVAPVILTDHARRDAAEVADGIRTRTGIEMDVDDLLASPHVFIGSAAGLAEKLLEVRERFGISSVMTGSVDELAPVVERLVGR